MAAAAGTISSTVENGFTVITGEFTWIVPVFNPLTARELEGPVFEAVGQRWRAGLRRHDAYNCHFVSLKWLGELESAGDEGPPPPLVRYKIVKLGSDNDDKLRETGWIPPSQLKEFRWSGIFSANDENRLDGVLQLRVEVAKKQSTAHLLKRKSQGQLIDAFRSLLEDSRLADLVVSFPEWPGQELKAHRAILAARSDVFAAMFQEGFESRELLEGRLVVEDIRPQVFHRLLEFIYTGDTEIGLKECPIELMAAADKYQLLDLKTLSAQHLATQITVENAGELLELAWKHETGELKRAVLAFVRENGPAVRASDGWKELKKNPELMFDLLDSELLGQQ